MQLFNTMGGAPEAVELGNSEGLQASCDTVSVESAGYFSLSFLGKGVACAKYLGEFLP